MAITLFQSDRFEPLWERFIRATDPATAAFPLGREAVVCPGAGWEAWLTRRLVRRSGQAVRPECSTLAAFLLGVQRRALGAEAEVVRRGGLYFDADAWTLRIAAAVEDAPPGPLAGWLAAGGGGDDRLERRVQLGRRLASLLDGYLLTRPELVEAMRAEPPALPDGLDDAGGHFAWQAALLGPLLRDSGLGPAGPAFRALAERLAAERPAVGWHPAVPPRVAVWVTGAVAPAQLDGLEMVAAAGCAVTVLVRHASSQFVADMLPAAWFSDDDAAALDDPAQHRDLPHPLLAAWGQVERDRKELLQAREDGTEREGGDPLWVSAEAERRGEGGAAEPADRRLLRAVQATVRGAAPPDPTRDAVDPDGSVAVHGCAGLRRQVEVLRDRLRVAFDELPGLTPEDVLVLCPDPEAFAPHVEAVFARRPRVDAHLAGRSPRRERPAVSAFFRLLDALGGRAEAPEVLGLLADPAFAGPDTPDAPEARSATLGEAVAAAGIRFGHDAAARVAAGRPDDATHTWEAGLDRLTLGSLVPPPGEGPPPPVGGWTPVDRTPEAEAVARLAAFVQQLHDAALEAGGDADARGWAGRAARWSDAFLADGFDDGGRAQVCDAAAALADDAEAAGLDHPLPLPVWAAELGRRLDAAAGGARFRPGGVTVCAPAAAAGLPHRVVAWLGLSDGAFPRRTPAAALDLAAAEHRPGDRPPAAVDRNLLLQSLAAAGDRFLIVFEDRDAAGDARPPAAVVEELREVVATLCGEAPVVHHPMHAFSPEAFDAERPGVQGVDQDLLEAARSLLASRENGDNPRSSSADAEALEAAAEERGLSPFPDDAVPLDDLVTLLAAAWKLRLRALGVGTDFEEATPEAEDPQETDGLEDWSLRDALLQSRLRGDNPEETRDRLATAGAAPAGPMGRRLLDRLDAEAAAVAAAAEREAGGPLAALAPLRVGLEVDGWRVEGELPRVGDAVHLEASGSSFSAARLAGPWVRHVALAAAGLGRPGRFVARSKKKGGAEVAELPPLDPDAARGHLATMLRWRERAQREPLPCDGGVAATLAAAVEPAPGVVRAALAGFHRSAFNGPPAPASDPDVALAFGDADPMALACADGRTLQEEMAEALWVPLMEHLGRREAAGGSA